MQTRGLGHTLLLALSTFALVIGSQVLIASCQEQRACREHKPCRVAQDKAADAAADAATVFHGYACDLSRALCYTKCENDEQCDRCNQYFCKTDTGQCIKDTNKAKPSICCTERYAANCGNYTCNTNLSECRKGDCVDDTHCNRCQLFFCNKTTKKCEKDEKRTGDKPTDCPLPPPEPTPEPTPDDAGGGFDTGGLDAGGLDAGGLDTGGAEKGG